MMLKTFFVIIAAVLVSVVVALPAKSSLNYYEALPNTPENGSLFKILK